MYGFKAITVFRGGANTPAGAVNTIAHEFKHLDPINMSMFNRGGDFRVAAEMRARIYGDRVEYIYRYGR